MNRYREFPRQLVAIDKGDDRDDDVEFTVGIYPTGSVEPLPSPTPAG